MATTTEPLAQPGMRQIMIQHTRRYPDWMLQDLYKLIYQAALGSEHAVQDEPYARSWLSREMAGLGPGPEEPLIDPISPDGSILRVHLRPFVRLGLDAEVLLQVFMRTAREVHLPARRLLEYGRAAGQLAAQGLLPFDAGAISAYIAGMQAAGFPAAHHSPGYQAAYQPAYRVVARAMLPEAILNAG